MEAHAGHRALRRGRVSQPGQIYLLTTVTAGRQPFFGDWTHAHVACRTLAKKSTWADAELLCWVLMPDHWHGIVRLGECDRLAIVVNRFKSLTTKALRRETAFTSSVWQPAYHDHALRKEEDMLAIARYIVANPVRAGLVRRIGDYPFWDAVWL